jgi:alpha-beta hydrolase superfamily lysophospholipase
VELIYAIRHGDDLAGLAVSDPAVATEAVPAALKAVTSVLSAVGPRLSVFKIEDDAISRDPEVVRAYQQDPLNYYGRLPARTLAEIRRSMDAMPRRVPGLYADTALTRIAGPAAPARGKSDGPCPCRVQ